VFLFNASSPTATLKSPIVLVYNEPYPIATL
jgi:hypothetical protein